MHADAPSRKAWFRATCRMDDTAVLAWIHCVKRIPEG